MNTRQQFEASLAVTPAAPDQAALTMRGVLKRVELEEALRRAHKAAQQRKWPAVGFHLNRAAHLFLGIPEDPMSRIEVREAASETLYAELKQRAKDGDVDAQRYLKIKPKKEAGRGPR